MSDLKKQISEALRGFPQKKINGSLDIIKELADTNFSVNKRSQMRASEKMMELAMSNAKCSNEIFKEFDSFMSNKGKEIYNKYYEEMANNYDEYVKNNMEM